MKTITYSKEILSGPDAGICTRHELTTTAATIQAEMAALNGITKANPGTDIYGAKFWVYNIGSEDKGGR